MIVEGARVTYQGEQQGLLSAGDSGRLLSISDDHGHVLFSSGKMQGVVEYLPLLSLASAQPSLIADALDAPEPLSSVSVRETVASAGEQGLVTALSESGVLDALASIGEEALEFVEGRVRSDPSMTPVMAALDADEQDEFVSLTSAMILGSAVQQSESGTE